MSTSFIHLVYPPGESAEHIAQGYGCTTEEIWALNPEIPPNDTITATAVKIPSREAAPLPPRAVSENSCLTPLSSPACSEALVDVVHVTGEQHFHVLTEKESRALKHEIDIVRKLMDDYHQQMASARSAAECQKNTQKPGATCDCVSCRQERWAVEAEAAGVLTRAQPEPARETYLRTDEDLLGRAATLEQAREWYRDYRPSWLLPSTHEEHWITMRNQKVLFIDQELHEIHGQLYQRRDSTPSAARKPGRKAPDASPPPAADAATESADSATFANDAAPDLKYGRGRSVSTEVGRQNRSGITVVEVVVFSDPSRRHYVPARYRERVTWSQRVSTRVLAGRPFNRELARDLIKDITSQISDSRKKGPLGQLSFKLDEWTSKEDNMLNALHQEAKWTHNVEGAIPYAIHSEAHALRFAASASAGINEWNPKKGAVNMGVKGSAAFSMAEASASLEAWFPSKDGFVASMDYRNAAGQTVRHPIGVFRLEGKLELSCFAGVKGSVDASAKVQYRPAEVTSGASALLGTPTLGVSRGTSIGVKAEGFAGAQVGGTLTGSLKWIEPQTSETGEVELITFEKGVDAQTLVEIKVEGNAALGAGISGDFGIAIDRHRLVVNCSGTMVFGPGAGGGFGTEVDLAQVGKLAKLLCTTLAGADYRLLLGVTEEAFNYICRSLLHAAIEVGEDVWGSVTDIAKWWLARNASWEESHRLVHYLIKHRVDKVMMVMGQPIPLSVLPPQTLGAMLHLLLEGCPFAVTEHYEQALVIMLSEIITWRQLIEVLEHTSPKGEKVIGMKTLEKINRLLDGPEQAQFNEFLGGLIITRPDAVLKRRKAWDVSPPSRKQRLLIAARSHELFTGLA